MNMSSTKDIIQVRSLELGYEILVGEDVTSEQLEDIFSSSKVSVNGLLKDLSNPEWVVMCLTRGSRSLYKLRLVYQLAPGAKHRSVRFPDSRIGQPRAIARSESFEETRDKFCGFRSRFTSVYRDGQWRTLRLVVRREPKDSTAVDPLSLSIVGDSERPEWSAEPLD